MTTKPEVDNEKLETFQNAVAARFDSFASRDTFLCYSYSCGANADIANATVRACFQAALKTVKVRKPVHSSPVSSAPRFATSFVSHSGLSLNGLIVRVNGDIAETITVMGLGAPAHRLGYRGKVLD